MCFVAASTAAATVEYKKIRFTEKRGEGRIVIEQQQLEMMEGALQRVEVVVAEHGGQKAPQERGEAAEHIRLRKGSFSAVQIQKRSCAQTPRIIRI